jgi:hypothetical protein
VLVNDPMNARPIVSMLLKGRATYTPSTERHSWELRGEGSLAGLFTRVLPRGGSSPTRVKTAGPQSVVGGPLPRAA